MEKIKFEKNRKAAKVCPCGKSNNDGKFAPFAGCMDKGHCHSCGKTFFVESEKAETPLPQTKVEKELFTIAPEQMEKTLCNYGRNSLVCCLVERLGNDAVVELLNFYECIGTSSKYPQATIYWQIDRLGNVRTGKIMNYGADLHRCSVLCKAGKPSGDARWAHEGLVPTYSEVRQCLFGEHLIRNNSKTICITEAEKTALIASLKMPEFVWLAAGSINGLTEYKMQALRGRNVILWPDAGKGFELWTQAARAFKHIANIRVNDVLERVASKEQKARGLDIADFLMK